jgi:RimJ/RimL family protein N-acetyltransferase
MLPRAPAVPPEEIDLQLGVLSRNRISDAPHVALAVRESLEHLRPWMPWATEAAAAVAAQTARSREAEELWTRGTDFVYVLRRPAQPEVVGLFGLHKRIGPNAIELGYWLHAGHTGHGYATAATAALTEAALELPDVDRIEIHTDEANLLSAAIPQRVAYRLDRVELRPPQAPGETGRLQIWVRP